jgi:hypothetical protein
MASKQTYAVACIELFTRVWAEFDSVLGSEDTTRPSLSMAVSARRLQILRLELIVALDACDSTRWRSQLDTLQRQSLGAVLLEVLDALDAPIDEIPRRSMPRAQNLLLDAVLEHRRALDERSEWLERRTASARQLTSARCNSFDR